MSFSVFVPDAVPYDHELLAPDPFGKHAARCMPMRMLFPSIEDFWDAVLLLMIQGLEGKSRLEEYIRDF
jgi:hypothetical protein